MCLIHIKYKKCLHSRLKELYFNIAYELRAFAYSRVTRNQQIKFKNKYAEQVIVKT